MGSKDVDGPARRLINGIKSGQQYDETNMNKYRRLQPMFRSTEVLDEILAKHGKLKIVQASRRRIHPSQTAKEVNR